jgi:3-deoxy-D-manno-octulosonic-acid transferase
LGLILTSPYWLVKGIRQRKYLDNFVQRLGFRMPSPVDPDRPLWIHAVSVGEVLSVKPLLSALRSVRPDLPVVVSTVTLTGMALAKKELAGTISVFFFPFDWAFCVKRFLKVFRPRAVVLMETELWPNFLNQCWRHGIPVFLVNGRISDKSWSRYRRLRWITRSMLSKIHTIGAQTELDRERMCRLGARRETVRVTGNLKFDFPASPFQGGSDLLDRIRDELKLGAETPVIVIGSSMKGEDRMFLGVFSMVRRALPGARLILAPRHPERFDDVARLIADSRIPAARRSQPQSRSDGATLFLLDSIGELRTVYSIATVVVIGGSFQATGGHNPLEAAALGKAIVFGPDMSNFREIAGVFTRENAARQCSRESLPQVLIDLLRDDPARDRLGRRALAAFNANRGAAERSAKFLLEQIG